LIELPDNVLEHALIEFTVVTAGLVGSTDPAPFAAVLEKRPAKQEPE
jgi:hypothetical protein